MTFDGTIHLAELFVLASAAWGFFKGGLAMRDAVRDLTGAVTRLDERGKDHEHRIRQLEGADRRSGAERRDWRDSGRYPA